MTDTDTPPDTQVPSDATAHVCERCGRPFTRESYLALHHGIAHPDELSPAEREAFASARETEDQDLYRFRLLALAALVGLYFGFLMLYAVVT